MTLVFFYFSVMETTYADSWSDMAQPCDMDLWVMKWRSAWPIFHGPVILPYILKAIWCMYIILLEYESVWPDVWPQNKCKSLSPIFHGPLILPCISKTIWWMSVIILGNETVWNKLWPQNKYRSSWPLFHNLVILLNIYRIIWWVNIIVGILD